MKIEASTSDAMISGVNATAIINDPAPRSNAYIRVYHIARQAMPTAKMMAAKTNVNGVRYGQLLSKNGVRLKMT